MNSLIHLLFFTVVAAVLFASSYPMVTAAPTEEKTSPEPAKPDDKNIFDIFRGDKSKQGGQGGQGLLHGVGGGVKGILSSVGESLGGTTFSKYYS